MRNFIHWITAVIGSAVLLVGGISATTRAEGLIENFYIGFQGFQTTVSNTNDNLAGFHNGTDPYYFVPHQLNSNSGYGLIFGASNDRLAGEISLLLSNHSGIGGGPADPTHYTTSYNSDFYLLCFDVKYFVSVGDQLKFYGLLGGNLSRLTVKNGCYDNSFSTSDNATFSGIGYDAGVGLKIDLSTRMTLDAAYIFRSTSVYQMTGLGQTFGPKDGTFSLNSSQIKVGLNYYF